MNAFNCTCRAGFTGDTCHDDIDECASAPCFNGGVCTQTRDASFECECAASEELMISHYEGDLCETEIGVNKIWFIVGGIAIFFLLVALCMSYQYVHNKKNVLVFQIETLDIGVAQFENARMSMVEESQGMIVIEVRMKNWDTIHDVCQRLQDREHIPIREQARRSPFCVPCWHPLSLLPLPLPLVAADVVIVCVHRSVCSSCPATRRCSTRAPRAPRWRSSAFRTDRASACCRSFTSFLLHPCTLGLLDFWLSTCTEATRVDVPRRCGA